MTTPARGCKDAIEKTPTGGGGHNTLSPEDMPVDGAVTAILNQLVGSRHKTGVPWLLAPPSALVSGLSFPFAAAN